MRTALLPLLGTLALTAAQSTTFTYQGQLAESGQPAEGLHDLRFRLFDAASAGNA